MAKIIFGTAIANIRGSIAGTVFSINANGAYIRNRATPTNSNTDAQSVVRSLFGVASSIWRSLTDSQKSTFASQIGNYPYVDSIGQTKTYTAAQLCMAVNTRLIGAGMAQVSEMLPPQGAVQIMDLEVGVLVDGTTFTLTTQFEGGATLVPADSSLIIEATPALSLGVTSPKSSDFRRLSVLADGTSAAGYNWGLPYQAVFGALPSTSLAVWVKVTVLNGNTAEYSTSFQRKMVIIP